MTNDRTTSAADDTTTTTTRAERAKLGDVPPSPAPTLDAPPRKPETAATSAVQADPPSCAGEAGGSCGHTCNYKEAGADNLQSNNNSTTYLKTAKIHNGWRQVSSTSWPGSFRAARAHRMPPGVKWQQVKERLTEDANTGEVIERLDADATPFSAATACRRLDRVRDVVTRVELRGEDPKDALRQEIDGSLEKAFGKLYEGSSGQNGGRVAWADLGSDSDQS